MVQLAHDEKELLDDFIAESLDALQDVSSLLISYEGEESAAQRRSIIDNVFRSIHTIKGNSSFFKLDDICKLAHTCENLLDDMRQDRLIVTEDIMSSLLIGTDTLAVLINNLGKSEQSIAPNELSILIDQIEGLRHEGDDPRVIIGIVHAQLKEILPQLGPSHKQALDGLVNLLAKNCRKSSDTPKENKPSAQAMTTAPMVAEETTIADHKTQATSTEQKVLNLKMSDESCALRKIALMPS